MNLDRLRSDVQGIGSVVASAVALISGLAQQLHDAVAADDMSAVDDLANQLEASQNDLATAVAANTVADSSGSADAPTDVPVDTPVDPAPTDVPADSAPTDGSGPSTLG